MSRAITDLDVTTAIAYIRQHDSLREGVRAALMAHEHTVEMEVYDQLDDARRTRDSYKRQCDALVGEVAKALGWDEFDYTAVLLNAGDTIRRLQSQLEATERELDATSARATECEAEVVALRKQVVESQALYRKIRTWGEQWCELATMHRKIVERVTMLSVEYQDKLDSVERTLNAVYTSTPTPEEVSE
jgi:hypothetical protein